MTNNAPTFADFINDDGSFGFESLYNEAPFNEALNSPELYDYQRDAVEALRGASLGKVLLPTGTGKTKVQAAYIADQVLNHGASGKTFVVSAHRIALVRQLASEIVLFLMARDIHVERGYIMSDYGTDKKGINDGIRKMRAAIEDEDQVAGLKLLQNPMITTRALKGGEGTSVETMLRRDMDTSKPSVNLIFVTYHSSDRLMTAVAETGLRPYAWLCDEAHKLCMGHSSVVLDARFRETAENTLFFTATGVRADRDNVDDDGNKQTLIASMDDDNMFGPTLVSKRTREAIDEGLITRPRLITSVRADERMDDEDPKRIPQMVVDAFQRVDEEVQKDSNGQCRAKLLVTLSTISQIESFLSSEQFQELTKGRGCSVFTIASKASAITVNGEQKTRLDMMRALRAEGAEDAKPIIALHVAILTEGIDVPGFNGILTLRTLSLAPFFQTYGRSSRLHPEDRRRLQLPEGHEDRITPDNVDNWTKPFSYVYLPNFNSTEVANSAYYADMVEKMREEFGDSPFDTYKPSFVGISPDEVELAEQDMDDHRSMAFDINAEVEDGEKAWLSGWDQLISASQAAAKLRGVARDMVDDEGSAW